MQLIQNTNVVAIHPNNLVSLQVAIAGDEKSQQYFVSNLDNNNSSTPTIWQGKGQT